MSRADQVCVLQTGAEVVPGQFDANAAGYIVLFEDNVDATEEFINDKLELEKAL